MKLEGKLKEGFFEWLVKEYEEEFDWSYYKAEDRFNDLPQSAQFGLIQEYADTLKYDLVANSTEWRIESGYFVLDNGYVDDRPEAQLVAVDKLNEIINK